MKVLSFNHGEKSNQINHTAVKEHKKILEDPQDTSVGRRILSPAPHPPKRNMFIFLSRTLEI